MSLLMLWHILVAGHQQEQCWLRSFIYYSQSFYGYKWLRSTFSDRTNIFADEIFKYTEAFFMLIPTYILQDQIMRVYSLLFSSN